MTTGVGAINSALMRKSLSNLSRREWLGAVGALTVLGPTHLRVLAQDGTPSSPVDPGSRAPMEIPPQNLASLTVAPPRPGPGDLPQRMERLLEQAIVRNDPTLAHDLYLPREAFRLIKGISDPDALWDRIFRAYDEDIHELHAQLVTECRGEDLSSVEFSAFRFTGRRAWVRLREETNRLPYWAQRHSWIDYRAGGRPRQIEVRTMIAWGDRWYITHLSEFR